MKANRLSKKFSFKRTRSDLPLARRIAMGANGPSFLAH
jgi:hypothetical protein